MTERTTTLVDYSTPQLIALVVAPRGKGNAKLALSDALMLWRVCGRRVCKQRHACSDAPDGCFERQWKGPSGDAKAAIRAFLETLAAGFSYERALAAADAESARHAALMADLAALRQRSGVQPVPAEPPPAALNHASPWPD